VTAYLDRQTFPRVFVHYGKQSQSAATFSPLGHEVVRPYVILASGSAPMTGIDAGAQTSAFTGLLAYLKTLRLPETVNTLNVHTPAFLAKARCDPTVPEPRPENRQPAYIGYQPTLMIIGQTFVPLGRPGLANRSANPSL